MILEKNKKPYMGMHVQACMHDTQRSAPRCKHYAIDYHMLEGVQKLQPATVQSRR